MPCEEWFMYLNGNEQLALVVRGKMHTLAKKASEITLKELRSSKEKPAWLKKRYEATLRALERAKREWQQTLESVLEGVPWSSILARRKGPISAQPRSEPRPRVHPTRLKHRLDNDEGVCCRKRGTLTSRLCRRARVIL